MVNFYVGKVIFNGLFKGCLLNVSSGSVLGSWWLKLGFWYILYNGDVKFRLWMFLSSFIMLVLFIRLLVMFWIVVLWFCLVFVRELFLW